MDNQEIEKKRAARELSIKEGSAYSVMEGFGLKYVTPYALSLGASNVFIGILGSVPQLLGTLSQLITVESMKKRTRKEILVKSITSQALLWIPFILIGYAYLSGFSAFVTALLLVLIYTGIIIAGTFPGPAWNSWMKDLVYENIGAYGGRRSRICGFVSLISMLFAGLILDYYGGGINGFAIIFIIAFSGRALSAYLMSKKYEPQFSHEENSYFSFIQFTKKMKSNNFGRFVIYSSLIAFSTSIASPFFAVYMLNNLQFSYLSFTLVTISSLLATIIFVPIWGKFADKHGSRWILARGGFLICLIPLLWTLVPLLQVRGGEFIPIYLVFVEAMSGFIWAGVTLATANFISNAVTRQRMHLCVAYHNVYYAFGTFFGALLGGFLAGHLNIGIEPLIAVFALSAILRFSVAAVMVPRINEVRPVEPVEINVLGALKKISPKKLWEYLEIPFIKS